MQLKQLQTLQGLRAVRDFLDRNEISVRMGPLTPHTKTLSASVDRLESLIVEQESRWKLSRSGTALKRRLARSVLLEYMRPIARVAPALFRDDVAMPEALSMPRRRQPSAVLAAAISMADNAAAHAKEFVDAGFTPDFIERLRTATAELKSVIDSRTKDASRRAASTAGTRDEIKHARHVLRLIDAMLSPSLERDPERLAEWRTLYRQVRQRVVSASAGSGSPSGGPAPVGGAVPVQTPVLRAA